VNHIQYGSSQPCDSLTNFLAYSDTDKQYEGFFLTAMGLKFLQNNFQIFFQQDSNQMEFF